MSVGNAADRAVIVLAAGAGSRFGGPKQLAEVDGVALLARVLASLERVNGEGIVVLGAHLDRVEELVCDRGWRSVRARDWERGTGASLRAGLAAAEQATSALIVLGDLAWLRPEAVDRVLAAAARAPASVEAVRAYEADRPGHPLLVRGELLGRARSAPDEGLRPLLVDPPPLAVECAGLGVARDVDTPDDLRREPDAPG